MVITGSLVEDGVLSSRLPQKAKKLPKIDGNVTLYTLKIIEKIAEEDPEKVFAVNIPLDLEVDKRDDDGHTQITFKSVIEKIHKNAKLLTKLAVKRGDIIHVCLPSSTEYHPILLASWMLGAVVSLADPNQSAKTFEQQINDVGPKVIFCSEDNKDIVLESMKSVSNQGECHLLCVTLKEGRTMRKDVLDHQTLLKDVEDDIKIDVYDKYDPTDDFLILWSSGTTGKPKAILHSAKFFESFDAHVTESFGFFLNTSKFFHMGGLVPAMEQLLTGKTLRFIPSKYLKTNINPLLKAIEKYKPETIMASAQHITSTIPMMKDLSSMDLSSVKHLCPVGSAISNDSPALLKEVFPNLVGFQYFYGLTEAGCLLTFSPTAEKLGVMLPQMVLKIVDLETRGKLGPNQVGEICCKTPYLTKGYLNHPEENSKLFDQEGFLLSGDLGHYDENGVVYYDGRLKELIKYNGYHVYPQEIENVITQIDRVQEAAVYSVYDHVTQEKICAAVVLDANSKNKVDENAIVEYVAQHVDDNKKIRGGVKFMDVLPRNTMGKITRKTLVQMHEKNAL